MDLRLLLWCQTLIFLLKALSAQVCSRRKSEVFGRVTVSSTIYFCCRHFVKTNNGCEECPIGHIVNEVNSACISCPEGRYGDKCTETCHCMTSERCDNVKGCVLPYSSQDTTLTSDISYILIISVSVLGTLLVSCITTACCNLLNKTREQTPNVSEDISPTPVPDVYQKSSDDVLNDHKESEVVLYHDIIPVEDRDANKARESDCGYLNPYQPPVIYNDAKHHYSQTNNIDVL